MTLGTVMKNTLFYRSLIVATVTMGFISSLAFPSAAQEKLDDDSLVLREIMRQLGRDMQLTTNAISLEDWERVAQLGEKIAEHPQPPMGEKMRIISYIGSNVGKFKEYDNRTHNSAKAMAAAAERGDGQAVIESFSNLQTSCLACHQSFRKGFLEHFYGNQ